MSAYARRAIAAPHLSRRLPDQGTAGTSHYRRAGSALPAAIDDELREVAEASDTGCALFVTAEATTLVVPPFPLPSDSDDGIINAEPLLEVVATPRLCAVFLLRLGGFAVAVFDGDRLVDSKVDQRFVKNRHRKGGQSQRRFERIREKQIDELFKKACETSRERLAPHEGTIEHVFLGGDRRTLQAFRKRCDYFDVAFAGRLRGRTLSVAGDPRHETLARIPRQLYSCEVYEPAAPA